MKFPTIAFLSERRRRERFWLALVAVLTVFFGFLEGWIFRLQSDLPLAGNVLMFALINLNVILLLLLAYLVLRNIVKLIFERKRNILGHKLRTRLVLAFVGLTLIPTVPLFWLATQFIFSSLDYWFSQRVEHSLAQSVTLATDFVEQEKKGLLLNGQLLAEDVMRVFNTKTPTAALSSEAVRASVLKRFELDGFFVFNDSDVVIWQDLGRNLPKVDSRALRRSLLKEHETPSAKLLTLSRKGKQEGLIGRILLEDPSYEGIARELVVVRVVPQEVAEKLRGITSGYDDYLQLKLIHTPLKRSHFITFSIVTLLTIFGAIWFGFYLAKGLTVPIQALVSATQSIAEGNLGVRLDTDRTDEIGMLMVSFNKMVYDLKESREQLDSAYTALQHSHVELEDRRRYMEVVLSNIAAGVVSLDSTGRIMTMNKSAEALFGLRAEEARGRLGTDFLQPQHVEVVKSFMDVYRASRPPYLEQQVQVMIGNRPMVLLIKVSILLDERDGFDGVVVVLDDLTELEKAQRMAAWREVARRIAHEIKNPLTPISLSAQRLRRRYAHLLDADGSILDECTGTIVQQVDHMKHLVNEFSKFARLPRAHPAPCDLASFVEESVAFYRHTYPDTSFSIVRGGDMPLLRLDRDQFKQVLNNLFDNALHALGEEHRSITLGLFYDPVLKIARLECADTGHGVSNEDKLRMFEPYYSTKDKGTGLGLAIVASIIADHNGFVRVRDNSPRGTVIVIELPG